MAEHAARNPPIPARRLLALGAVLLGVAGWIVTVELSHASEKMRSGTGLPVATDVRRSTWTLAAHGEVIRGALDRLSQRTGDGTVVPIIDLAVDPASGAVFGRDASNRLASLEGAAAESGTRFQGLLAGFTALDDGRSAVLFGRSGYGSDYFVRVSGSPAPNGAAGFEVGTGFCTRLLAGNGRALWYATKQARLVRINAHGLRDWQLVLPQIPTALAVATDGTAAAADDTGAITLVSPTGMVKRHTGVGEIPLVTLAFIRGGTALAAADRSGRVGVFDRHLRRLGTYTSGLHEGRVHTILERGDDLLLIAGESDVCRLHLPSTLPTVTLRMFEWRRAAALAGFAALAGVGALTFSRRVTRELRQATRRVFAARAAYLLLLPTFLLLAVFTYYPMGTALGYSFWKFSLTSPMEFVGLDNFREMAHDPYLRRAVVNMIILLATGIVKMIVLPLLAAELVFWIASPRLQQFFRAAVTFPAVIPGVVMVLVWKMIYDPYSGLVNMTLRALRLANLQHAWLGDEHYALWAVVFFHFPWINLLIFLIFLGGLLQVDRNIFEAADIDGASVTQRFLHIDIPALRPKLQLALTLIFLWSVQDYASVLIFTGGGPGVSTYVPALHMFLQISGGQNFGYSSAIGLVLFLLVLAFTFTSRRFNREELP